MLFVVSSPIGNLDDLSINQAKTLLAADIILAEDTRSSQILLDAIRARFEGLKDNQPKIFSYYKDREFEKLPGIIDLLKEGKNICLLSENGTPLVSDPGYLLVKSSIKEGIPMTVVPGPSAVITALIHSGFNPSPKDGGFSFLGFFPKKPSDGKHMIKKMIDVKKIFPDMVFVFYESPLRLNETLNLISSSGWDPDIAVAREMTKKFEEVIRGKARDIKDISYRGEITLVIS